jgi:hypothetical protein
VGKEKNDSAALQNTINEIHAWAETWQMKIHPGKTSVLHVGPNNSKHTYRLNNSDIVATEVQQDIGFLIPESLLTSNQIQKA